MRQLLRHSLWIAIMCMVLGCSHTSDRASNVPQPKPAVVGMAQGTPKVELVETSFNFGEIKEDGDYVHEFIVKNTGNGVLEIQKVLPG